MTKAGGRLALVALTAVALVLTPAGIAAAKCPLYAPTCLDTKLEGGTATIDLSGESASTIVGSQAVIPDYQWRLQSLCVISDEADGTCSGFDFRPCPDVPGRVIRYFVLEQRPIVRADGTAADAADGEATTPGPGLRPGDPAGPWLEARQGCFDITALNPPPSPAEVFSYFQRLPLPRLTTQHQPPGNGLSGLPVIFYTDSPTAQTFTVDVRGFTVVITATAEQFTWHTGDSAGDVTSADPGRPYPDQTVEHDYRSGTYTAYVTVTWGATFTVDGSAPADVPGTTTTDGPPVTFDVLQARPVLTNPYD
jgi:hypothetical protein